MSCDSFDALVVDLCREGKDQPAFSDAALAHAAICARCDSILAAQRKLTRGLHALAEESARVATPAAVEVALRAAFKRRVEAGQRPATTRAPRVWPWLAAAAVLLAAGISLWGPSRDPSPQSPLVAQAVPAAPLPTPSPEPLPAKASRATPAESREAPSPAVSTRDSRARRPRERPRPTQAIFVPLVPNDSLADLGQGWVVRVGLSRAALASWGWSLEGGVGAETVEAELLVGEDGVARAIRVEQ